MPKTAPHFAGFDDWIEVFRSGEHTSSSGEKRAWSNADLDQMVATHNAEHPAPLVVGHPETDSPAFGWVAGLKRAGDTLLAKFRDVAPELADAVKANRFRNRSIKVLQTDTGLAVGHVGLLGAALPAVKGLAPIQFDGEAVGTAYEFAIPEVKPKEDEPMTFTQADLDKAAQTAADKAKADAATAHQAVLDGKNAELKKLQFAQRLSESKAVIEGFAIRGDNVHLTPAQCEGLAEFRTGLADDATEFTFTAADKTEKKSTRVALFDSLLKGLPVQMKLNQPQGGGDPGAKPNLADPTVLAAKAVEFQAEEAKKGRVITIAEAVATVGAKPKTA